MRLELELATSVLDFTERQDGGPFPWLLKTGTLRLQARAGSASGRETASMDVVLDNTARQCAGVIGQPLRALATIYDNDDGVFFAGVVSALLYKQIVTMTIEA